MMVCTGYQCDDHGVEVEEEHDQMESKFNETLFLVTIKSTENLRCIQHMMSVQHPEVNPFPASQCMRGGDTCLRSMRREGC
jgi:hypothetical protein